MPNKIPLAVPFISGSWSQLPSKPSTVPLVTPQPLCPLPPTPAHTPQSAENLRSPTLDSWALGRFAPSCPAPTVCVSGGASLGIVTETPTWPSPERLAAGQGVAGMWGGGCSVGGVRVCLACPCSWEGPGPGRWEPSRGTVSLCLPISLLLPRLPRPPLSCSVCLSLLSCLHLSFCSCVSALSSLPCTAHPECIHLRERPSGQRRCATPIWVILRALGTGGPVQKPAPPWKKPHRLPEDVEPPSLVHMPVLTLFLVGVWPMVLSRSVCPAVCDPRACSLPRSSVHGILQARRLWWVAIFSSR